MTDDFQVYLYDETHSNSTHVSLGKNKTCDWAVLASGWMMMEFTTLRYKLSLFSVSWEDAEEQDAYFAILVDHLWSPNRKKRWLHIHQL